MNLNLLKRTRLYKGYQQYEVADGIGISRQTYNAIENGKKKLNWTVFLALFAVFSSDERTLKMLDSMEVFQEGVAKEMWLPFATNLSVIFYWRSYVEYG